MFGDNVCLCVSVYVWYAMCEPTFGYLCQRGVVGFEKECRSLVRCAKRYVKGYWLCLTNEYVKPVRLLVYYVKLCELCYVSYMFEKLCELCYVSYMFETLSVLM